MCGALGITGSPARYAKARSREPPRLDSRGRLDVLGCGCPWRRRWDGRSLRRRRSHAPPRDGGPLSLRRRKPLARGKALARSTSLAWGTAKENVADMATHGTHCRGERHHFARFTPADITAIMADPRTNTEVARAYGVSKTAIYRIRLRLAWAHASTESQARARREPARRIIELDGVSLTLAEWSRRTGLGEATIRARLARGWDSRRALTEATP
jgi:hypothetical protein